MQTELPSNNLRRSDAEAMTLYKSVGLILCR
jgi:hypothetical protein